MEFVIIYMTSLVNITARNVQIQSFFWSVFYLVWTKYGDLLRKSPHSVQILENTDQKKLRILTLITQCMTFVNVVSTFASPKTEQLPM